MGIIVYSLINFLSEVNNGGLSHSIIDYSGKNIEQIMKP